MKLDTFNWKIDQQLQLSNKSVIFTFSQQPWREGWKIDVRCPKPKLTKSSTFNQSEGCVVLHDWAHLPHNLWIKLIDCSALSGCVWRQVQSINFVAGVRTLGRPGASSQWQARRRPANNFEWNNRTRWTTTTKLTFRAAIVIKPVRDDETDWLQWPTTTRPPFCDWYSCVAICVAGTSDGGI